MAVKKAVKKAPKEKVTPDRGKDSKEQIDAQKVVVRPPFPYTLSLSHKKTAAFAPLSTRSTHSIQSMPPVSV